MKTNKEMFREYQLNGITVVQRTKDAYFNANALIHEYNKLNPNHQKDWRKFFNRNFSTQEFVFTILKREFPEELCNCLSIKKRNNCSVMQQFDNEEVLLNTSDNPCNCLSIKKSNNCSIIQQSDYEYNTEIVKSKGYEKLINKVIVKRVSALRCKGEIDKIWVHPLVFLDFCMWLNPDFKYDAVKMVYDNLIQLRIEVCDNEKPFRDWITTTFGNSTHNITNIYIALNKAVFGYHDKEVNQRDYATIEELEQLKYYQRLVQDFVKAGFFTKVKDITQYLKKEQEKNFVKI